MVGGVEEEAQGDNVHEEVLGKSEGLAHEASESLAQSQVEALDMIGLSFFLGAAVVLLGVQHLSRGSQGTTSDANTNRNVRTVLSTTKRRKSFCTSGNDKTSPRLAHRVRYFLGADQISRKLYNQVGVTWGAGHYFIYKPSSLGFVSRINALREEVLDRRRHHVCPSHFVGHARAR